MATRSPRPTRPSKKTGAAGSKRSPARKSRAKAKDAFEDVAERAARLGITVDKVLLEYARIAFADPRHVVDWDADGLHIHASKELSADDVATIHEISGGGASAVHVKLYDKKAALDAIARHLGMFPAVPRGRDEKAKPDDPAEDPRELLKRRLARLAAELGQG